MMSETAHFIVPKHVLKQKSFIFVHNHDLLICSYLDSHDNLASMMFVLTSYFSVLTVTLMIVLLRQRYTLLTTDVSVDKLEWVIIII